MLYCLYMFLIFDFVLNGFCRHQWIVWLKWKLWDLNSTGFANQLDDLDTYSWGDQYTQYHNILKVSVFFGTDCCQREAIITVL